VGGGVQDINGRYKRHDPSKTGINLAIQKLALKLFRATRNIFHETDPNHTQNFQNDALLGGTSRLARAFSIRRNWREEWIGEWVVNRREGDLDTLLNIQYGRIPLITHIEGLPLPISPIQISGIWNFTGNVWSPPKS